MSTDEQHVALPKLYGAPAYARPAPAVAAGPRPFDPDDLPIEAHQTDDEREFTSTLPARAWAPGGAIVDRNGADAARTSADPDQSRRLLPRPLRLKSIAGRLLGGD